MGHFWKRGIPVLACALALGSVAPASAYAQDHGGGEVQITQTGDSVSIGNNFLTRTFSIQDGKWSTASIVNKRVEGDLTLTPQAGSEDFVIKFVSNTDDPTVTLPTQALKRDGWKATVTNKDGKAFTQTASLFDGKKDTYIDETAINGYPVSVVIDLGSEQKVGSFSYDKRPGYSDANYGLNGTMGSYKLYVSDNGKDWDEAGSGSFSKADYNLHDANGLHNVGDTVYANFDKVYTTRYVKIEQLSDALGSTQEFTGAEINLFFDQKKVEQPTQKDTDIRTSELTVADNGVTVDQKANSVRVEFEPISFEGSTWQIAEVTAMEDGAHYMNSHLEIKASDPDAAAIDYIDTDSFVLPSDAKDVWSIPDESKISSMWIGKHELTLGQPIYVDGLFLGPEFPVEESDVIDSTHTTKMRYYSGKTLEKMAEDGQDTISSDDGSVTFRTWSNVVGAAEGTKEDVVQTDFFSYIEDIATPSEFRKQYNSWYDNMMAISPTSVAKSFMGTEKGLAQNGIEPLDAYVVDDGWNNYNSREQGMAGTADSGTTYNQTGFWEFNSKWPNELYDSASLAHSLQSSFGMWVGPQGGYNYFGQFGRFLEEKGTGYTQHNSALGDVVCTGSHRYLKNFTERFLDYQKRFDIDYWKWDGFASRPCNDASHDHMVGGANDMYYTSDMWEQWTNLFDTFREARAKEGKDLWINATCYVNPSPWLLQWVNTIWLQDSGDTGQANNEGAARHQQKIYYRDHVYYNMFKNNDLQFPLQNVYNHDPIYGVSDNSDATTEVFREYLLDNAMRGTAFWELYYSPSLMDEAKWQVTADVLDFAERNHDILKNAKLFSDNTAFNGTDLASSVNGVYGYSAWNTTAGIVSFVNPTETEQTYTLTLDNLVGVPTSMKSLQQTQIYPYAAASSGKSFSYGDKLTVTLKPHSSQIFQFGTGDTQAPQITSAKITGNNTVRVAFNTRMNNTTSFKVNGQNVEAKLLDDYRTFELSCGDLGSTATLEISGAKSVFGVDAQAGVNGVHEIQTAGTLASLKSAKAAKAAGGTGIQSFETGFSKDPMLDLGGQVLTVANQGVKGMADFSVQMAVKTTSAGVTLASQGSDWSLALDDNGYVTFKVGDITVSSQHAVTTVTSLAHGTFGTSEYVPTQTATTTAGAVNDNAVHTITASRELNGMVKLYVDGELVNSGYNQGKLDDLSGAAVSVGAKNLTGFVSGVTVANAAAYYDDAEQQATDYSLGKTSTVLSQEGWSATACSQQTETPGTGSDGAAADVVDGNPSTYWHSNWSGADTHEGPHTLTVDFGKTITFDNLIYTGRPGGGNGDWQTVKIVGIAQDGTETVIRDTQDVKLDANRQAVFAFDTPQTYAKVRFEITGQGGFASAAEITASQNFKTVDTTPVDELRAYAEQLSSATNKADYTQESYAAFAKAYTAVMALNPFDVDSAAQVDALKANLDAAHAALKPVGQTPAEPGNKEDLQQRVDALKSEGLDAKNYSSATWGAYQNALATAEAVLNDPNATQEQIDAALAALNEARAALAPKENAGGGQQEDQNGQQNNKNDSAWGLPTTGDISGLVMGGVVSAAVAALLAGGIVALRKRMRNE